MLATDADGLGVALRALIADDAQWVLDIMLSARRASERLGTLLPMLMLGHSSRIVYEGSKALRTDPTGRQVQPFVDLLPPTSSPVIMLLGTQRSSPRAFASRRRPSSSKCV